MSHYDALLGTLIRQLSSMFDDCLVIYIAMNLVINGLTGHVDTQIQTLKSFVDDLNSMLFLLTHTSIAKLQDKMVS